MQRQNQKQIVQEVLHNRGQYAALVTGLLGFVLSSASVLVLWFEAPTPGANITTGGDAIWWAIVTITTVGYGDKYPITAVGRITAVFVMVAGVGIIGTLAGILSGVLLSPPAAAADHEDNSAAEPEAIRNELAALRSALQQQR
jgi:voltage-gated potassium channel